MSDVFISYAHENRDFVERLRDALQEQRKDGWVDWDRIPPAAPWMAEIKEAIDQADVFVFVISSDSVASKVCVQELAHAVGRNKRIVPVLLTEVDTASLPSPLPELNWVLLREGDNFAAGVAHLVQAVDTDLEHVKDHTRLLVRAELWQRRGGDPSVLLRDEELADAERWLAAAADRVPASTMLHASFVAASRDAQDARLAQDAQRLERARRGLYAAQLSRVESIGTSDPRRAEALLESLEDAPLDLRDLAWGILHRRYAFGRQTLNGGPGTAGVVAMAPDGQQVAAGFACGTVALWRVSAPHPLIRMGVLGGAVSALTFSADGKRLGAGSERGEITQWLGRKAHVMQPAEKGHAPVCALTFDGQGLWAAIERKGSLCLYASNAKAERILLPAEQKGRSWRAAFSAGARYLTAACNGDRLYVLAIHPPGPVRRLDDEPQAVTGLALSADGKRLAVAYHRGEVSLLEVASGARRGVAPGEGATVASLAFTADGRGLVTGGGEYTRHRRWSDLRLWVLDDEAPPRVLHGLYGSVCALGVSGDATRLVAAGRDGRLLLLSLSPHPERGDVNGAGALAWSPDGRRMAFGLPQGGVVDQGRVRGEAARLEGFDGTPSALAWSPDGRHLAAATADGLWSQVRVWALPEGGPGITVHEGGGQRLAWSPTGDQLAAACGDQVVLWSASDGTPRVFAGDGGRVLAIAFSPDGRLIATGHWRNLVSLWASDSGEQLATLRGHSAAVVGLAFTGDGQFLISASEKDPVLAGPNRYLARQHPELIQWDIRARCERLRVELEHKASPLTTLFMTPDRRTLVTGHADGAVALWDPMLLRQRLWLSGHSGPVASLAVAPDGRSMAAVVAGKVAGIGLWYGDDWAESVRLDGHRGQVYAVAFSPEAGTLYSASGYDGGEVVHPGQILRWDVATGAAVSLLREHDNAVVALAVSPDGGMLAALCQRGLVLMDLASGGERRFKDIVGKSPSTLTFSPDGLRLLVAGSLLEVHSEVSKVVELTADKARRAVNSCFSPAGNRVALSAEGSPVQILDATSGEVLASGADTLRRPAPLCFLVDGALLAVGRNNGRITLHRSDDLTVVHTFKGHSGPVHTLAVSADGEWLASGGGVVNVFPRPGEAILWALATRRRVRTLYGHSCAVRTVAFSPDSRCLATGGRSQREDSLPGEVRLWPLLAGPNPVSD